MNVLAKKIYNSVLAEHEEYDMIELSWMDTFSNDFFFSKIEVYDSFYLQGTLDRSLTPFFGEELVGKDVSYVFALLGFYDLKGQKALYEEQAMIIKCGDFIYSFLNPNGIQHAHTFGLEENLEFGSYIFLTANSVTKYYDEGDNLYEFRLKRDENGFSLYLDECIAFVENTDITTEFYVDQNSFKMLEASVTIDLLEQTYVERIIENAKITHIGNDMSIDVENEKLPALKTIAYRKILNSNYNIHMESLRAGDIVEFYYYMRTPNYVPISINCDYIIFISHS